MPKKLSIFTTVVAIVTLMVTLTTSAFAAPVLQDEQDIVTVAVEDGRFTTLAAALEAAGLVETLQGEGPFTVFAPTDEAFDALPEGALDELLADTDALTEVLLYHVVAGEVPAADVVNLDSADTVAGMPVTITVDGDTVMVNDATVTAADVPASNGIIHVIDTVLLPPSDDSAAMEEGEMTEEDAAMQEGLDIVDTAVADGRFTTLATALEAAGLIDTLKGEGPFTVFAPTDEAFAALPEGTLDELLADTAALTDVLLYHVVPGSVMAADVVTLDTADTVLGAPVDITVDGESVMVNEANVVITDIEATNGVIHVIDSVLLPPSDDSAAMEEGEMAEATGESVASCEDYTVQADDWLSRISERFLGDILAYPTLVDATNAAAAESDRYTVIDNPDIIEIGQIICVPAGTEGEATEGEAMEGEAMEGEATEGEATEGEATEGEATEGEATEGEAMEGEATEGEATEGETTEGESTVNEAFIPEPGRSKVYVFNEYAEEIGIDINGQAYRIPTGTPDDGIFIDLDPGKYTYTLSIPGGAANGEVEVGADQTWGFGVRGDGAVYTPSQLYP